MGKYSFALQGAGQLGVASQSLRISPSLTTSEDFPSLFWRGGYLAGHLIPMRQSESMAGWWQGKLVVILELPGSLHDIAIDLNEP